MAGNYLYFNTDTNNDRWIVEQVFQFKRGGFFVEAGACDGVEGSNTLALESQFDWSGICIEPSLQWFSSLCQNRRCICDNSCLSNDNKRVQFVESYGWGGILSNLGEGKKPHWGQGEYVEKETRTLESVLQKYNAPDVIDFLALDIEGSELSVLSVFPFDKYKVLAISIEGGACNELLFSEGYIRVHNPFNKLAPWETYFLHQTLFVGDAARLLGAC